MNKHKLQSLMGFIGGVFFMAGDCLIYCYKGTTGGEIDPLWVDVAMWRFKGTVVEGAYGAFESLGEALTFLTAYFYWRKIKTITMKGK